MHQPQLGISLESQLIYPKKYATSLVILLLVMTFYLSKYETYYYPGEIGFILPRVDF